MPEAEEKVENVEKTMKHRVPGAGRAALRQVLRRPRKRPAATADVLSLNLTGQIPTVKSSSADYGKFMSATDFSDEFAEVSKQIRHATTFGSPRSRRV